MDQGASADRLMLAMFLDPDGKVSGNRPSLIGAFTMKESADAYTFRGAFDGDAKSEYEIRLVDRGLKAHAHLEEHFDAGADKDIDDVDMFEVSIKRTSSGAPSQADRLRAASVWALVGSNVNTPSTPATFEVGVLGTQLVRSEEPAMFGGPGTGTWLLLKVLQPDELYVAMDLVGGRVEWFPKVPLEPTQNARALFDAL
jgi:hypothetical protein